MEHTPKIKSAKSIPPLERAQSPRSPYQRMNTLKSMVIQQNSPRKIKLIDKFSSVSPMPSVPVSRRSKRNCVVRQSPMTPGLVSEPLKAIEQVKPQAITNNLVKMEDRYDLQCKLSSTDYADVYLAKDTFENSTVVMKITNSLRLFSERACKERLILQKLAANGKGLLKTHFSHNNSICFVLQQCTYSLAEANSLILPTVRKIAFSLIRAIRTCNSIGIIHASISPGNVMFLKDKFNKLRLIGFSESSLLSNKKEPRTFSRYKAPELILGCPFNTTVDVWSFGCIFAEMLIGAPLFSGNNDTELLESIMKVLGRPPHNFLRLASKRSLYFTEDSNIFQPISGIEIAYVSSLRSIQELDNTPGVIRLIELCLDWNPVNRLEAVQVLRHPYFNIQRSSSRLPQINTCVKRQISSNFRELPQTPR